MILNEQIQNIEFCPFIDTEKIIIESIKDNLDSISDEYELMPYPLAHWINTRNVDNVNYILSILNTDKKRVFICQHNFVEKLKFKSTDLVFTPHSSESDNFISIPHISINWNKEYIKNEKNFKFSFLGSSKTHWTRKGLIDLYPDNCFDSGQYWGLDKNMTKEFNDKYIKMIGDSYFSLCPRGTGISTVRLFESIYMNSIPVIIADGYKKPMSDIINWDEFSITIKEKDIDKIAEIIKSVSDEEIAKKQERLKFISDNYINNNIIDIILKKLKDKNEK
jgi:hypothetical protein